MPEKKTCILIYSTYEDAWQAVEQLQTKKINLQAVSVVCNTNDREGQVVGVYTHNGSKYFQGTQAAFWQRLWEVLDGELFFVTPEFEALSAAGAIVPLLLKAQENIDILGQFSALAAALFDMGVPENSVRQYEAEIKTGSILLIVNSHCAEVERSYEILHSERQRATVHLA